MRKSLVVNSATRWTQFLLESTEDVWDYIIKASQNSLAQASAFMEWWFAHLLRAPNPEHDNSVLLGGIFTRWHLPAWEFWNHHAVNNDSEHQADWINQFDYQLYLVKIHQNGSIGTVMFELPNPEFSFLSLFLFEHFGCPGCHWILQ